MDFNSYDDLWVVCRTGEIDKVRYYVEIDCQDINALDDFDSSALYYACLGGHHDVVRYLLESGASCQEGTFDGERCFYVAHDDDIRRTLRKYKQVGAHARLQNDPYVHFLRGAWEDCEALADDVAMSMAMAEDLPGAGGAAAGAEDLLEAARALARPDVIVFVVGAPRSPAAELAVLPVHAAVLAARAPFFLTAVLFRPSYFRQWSAGRVLRISNSRLHPAALEKLFRFLYSARLACDPPLWPHVRRLFRFCNMPDVVAEVEAAYGLQDLRHSQEGGEGPASSGGGRDAGRGQEAARRSAIEEAILAEKRRICRKTQEIFDDRERLYARSLLENSAEGAPEEAEEEEEEDEGVGMERREMERRELERREMDVLPSADRWEDRRRPIPDDGVAVDDGGDSAASAGAEEGRSLSESLGFLSGAAPTRSMSAASSHAAASSSFGASSHAASSSSSSSASSSSASSSSSSGASSSGAAATAEEMVRLRSKRRGKQPSTPARAAEAGDIRYDASEGHSVAGTALSERQLDFAHLLYCANRGVCDALGLETDEAIRGRHYGSLSWEGIAGGEEAEAALERQCGFGPFFSDVRFCLGDGVVFHAHRFLLRRRSEYFEAMFESHDLFASCGGASSSSSSSSARDPPHEAIPSIDLSGTVSRPVLLYHVLHYLYTGNFQYKMGQHRLYSQLRALDPGAAPKALEEDGGDAAESSASCDDMTMWLEMLKMADMFLLPRLKQQISSVLSFFMDPDNVFVLMEIAELYGLPSLEERCVACLAAVLEDVVDRPEFAALIAGSAASIADRQETDSIPLVDEIRSAIEDSVERALHLLAEDLEEAADDPSPGEDGDDCAPDHGSAADFFGDAVRNLRGGPHAAAASSPFYMDDTPLVEPIDRDTLFQVDSSNDAPDNDAHDDDGAAAVSDSSKNDVEDDHVAGEDRDDSHQEEPSAPPFAVGRLALARETLLRSRIALEKLDALLLSMGLQC